VTVGYHERGAEFWLGEYWMFTAEPKLYMDSNHVTRISLSFTDAVEKVKVGFRSLWRATA